MKRHPNSLTPAENRDRLKACAQHALDGLNLSQSARKLGLKLPTLSLFLKRNDPSIKRALKENGEQTALAIGEARARLAAVVEHGQNALGITMAAADLGISYPALAVWLWKYAPDGAAAALADFDDSD